MCNKAVDNYTHVLEFVIRLKKCMMKVLIFVLLYLILFLIDIRPKKYVINLFLKILLCKNIERYRAQEMCDKAVYACLLTLKFVPDWFVAKTRY